MKKTYNINLNGQVFCIDDDACLKLQSYIDTLESHYLKEEDGREIMADIESRIAELLKEALGKGYKQVVTMEDIDQIIRIMGSPDVIIDEDTDKSTEPIKRKLYRDTDESVLGGVASGIAAYFDISVVWIRIAFVLLAFFYGVTILVYIILWIATPAAVTARQKMEMKGEKINVSNIEKNIRDTYDDLKKNSGIQKFFTGIENGAKTCFQKLNTILRKCLKIVFSVLSVVGLLAGTFLFILVFWCLLYPESVTNFSIYHILCSSISSELLLTLKIILLLTLNIPLLLIIYISARYLFQFNWNKIFLLTAIGCWFLAGFAGIIITIQQSLSYSDVTEETEGHPFITTDTTSHKYLLKIDDLPQVSENSNIHPYEQIFCKYTGIRQYSSQRNLSQNFYPCDSKYFFPAFPDDSEKNQRYPYPGSFQAIEYHPIPLGTKWKRTDPGQLFQNTTPSLERAGSRGHYPDS